MSKKVDVIIVSYAKTPELEEVTKKCIESLKNSEEDYFFTIIVVESNLNVTYECDQMIRLASGTKFNYNKFLNYGIKAGDAKYVALCNNDILFEKNWASEIIKQMEANPELMSASPFCPETQSEELKSIPVIYGYGVRQQLNGWCIFQQRDIYKTIKKLHEGVEFWFSDNLYGSQIQSAKIKHGLVTNSVVHHHPNNLGATGSSILSEEEKARLTVGQHELYKNIDYNSLNNPR